MNARILKYAYSASHGYTIYSKQSIVTMALSILIVRSHFVLGVISANTYEDCIPTVPFQHSFNTTFLLKNIATIIVDARYANLTGTAGSTLIPPTLESFANTFAEDLSLHSPKTVSVELGNRASLGSIFLTLGNATSAGFTDAAGRPTNEGVYA